MQLTVIRDLNQMTVKAMPFSFFACLADPVVPEPERPVLVVTGVVTG